MVGSSLAREIFLPEPEGEGEKEKEMKKWLCSMIGCKNLVESEGEYCPECLEAQRLWEEGAEKRRASEARMRKFLEED
jgi:hypothetical protein